MTKPGRIIWLTGLPAVGKTAVAQALVETLAGQDKATLWLDSDPLRRVITPQAQYNDSERDYFYAVVGHIALLGVEGGVTVVISATAPKQHYRNNIRQQCHDFVEVWLTCSPQTLRRRDVKGLYTQSDAGAVTTLPGRGSPYEAPSQYELALSTDERTPEDLAQQILSYRRRDA